MPGVVIILKPIYLVVNLHFSVTSIAHQPGGMVMQDEMFPDVRVYPAKPSNSPLILVGGDHQHQAR